MCKSTLQLFVLLISYLLLSSDSYGQAIRGWAAAPYLAEGNYSDVPVKDKMQLGNWVTGGNITSGYSGGMLTRQFSYSATAQMGYLVATRLVGGIQISYGADHFKYKMPSPPATQVLKHRFHSFTPELFGRYYITSYKVKPFIHVSAGPKWLWGTQAKADNGPRNLQQTQFSSSVAAGFSWLFKSRWTIEAMYQHQLTTDSQIIDGNSKSPLRIGVNFFLE